MPLPALRIDNALYPFDCFLHIVVDAGLMVDATAEPSAGNADQRVPPAIVDNERPTRVTQASILMSIGMAGAEHLVEQLHVDVFAAVPSQTFFCT